jgi:putative transcriptional regulator
MVSKLIKGAREALAFVKGDRRGAIVHVVHVPDIQAIRTDLGLTQTAFAKKFQIPVATIRDWEQGRRQPDQAARNFLRVVAKNPKAVMKALG